MSSEVCIVGWIIAIIMGFGVKVIESIRHEDGDDDPFLDDYWASDIGGRLNIVFNTGARYIAILLFDNDKEEEEDQ